MRGRTGTAALMLIGVVAATSGCSTTHETTSTTVVPTDGNATATPASVRPTLAAPNLQPPSQNNQYTAGSSRPKVVFDPCTWIGDDAIEKAGFDPASRRRGSDQIAEVTFLTCRFDATSKLKTLDIDSGNATWQEDQAKNASWLHTVAPIDGRQAASGHDPDVPGSCEIHLRTQAGVVFVSILLTLQGRTQGADPCEGLPDIATDIEPSIGKDN